MTDKESDDQQNDIDNNSLTYYQKNKLKVLEYQKKYNQENIDKIKIYHQKRHQQRYTPKLQKKKNITDEELIEKKERERIKNNERHNNEVKLLKEQKNKERQILCEEWKKQEITKISIGF